MVIINPNNPTGFVSYEKYLFDILKLAHQENLVLISDEVSG